MENLTEKQIDELARIKRNEQQREWHNRKENRGKRAEYQKNYFRKLALEELAAKGMEVKVNE